MTVQRRAAEPQACSEDPAQILRSGEPQGGGNRAQAWQGRTDHRIEPESCCANQHSAACEGQQFEVLSREFVGQPACGGHYRQSPQGIPNALRQQTGPKHSKNQSNRVKLARRIACIEIRNVARATSARRRLRSAPRHKLPHAAAAPRRRMRPPTGQAGAAQACVVADSSIVDFPVPRQRLDGGTSLQKGPAALSITESVIDRNNIR